MNDYLLAEAALGRDAEEFCKTDVGRYILGRCEQEIAEAHAGLVDAEPSDARLIQYLQNKAWRAKSVQGWIAELIEAGSQAEAMLSE